MSYKTTKKDFADFKKECEKWIAYFGLIDWQVHFDHEERNDCRAAIYYDCSGKVCTITLNTIWTHSAPGGMKKLAFHEVCELLLGPLSEHAGAVYNHGIVQEQVHTVIRRLENTIFKESL